ncbi:MAG: helicase [Cenarchaeum symbiont of Oopsacas minuta]|nr:helicase [Cenarchaeum symbiont of Oopsacas minuta]
MKSDFNHTVSKYPCPNCKTNLTIDITFDKRIHILCPSCELGGLFDGNGGTDIAIMEFACRYDEGKLSKSDSITDSKMVRKKSEIVLLTKGYTPNPLTKSILYSKKDYIVCYKRLSRPKPVSGGNVSESGIDQRLADALVKSGISKLYKFQRKAIDHILAGKDIVIEAPTASGKTEAFLIPILHMVGTKRTSSPSILIIYPTKALAHDQYSKVKLLAVTMGLDVAVFDGDVGAAHRSDVLSRKPDIIITNFDVLHYHMMRRTRFASLLSSIRFTIVDETHVYTGIFGSNVHYIIKRLKRLASSRIQFIASSATLHNSENFCKQLFGVDMERIVGEGAKSKIDFVIMFPSLRTQRSLMIDLTKKLTDAEHKTIVFSGSHQNAELLAMQAKKLGVSIKVHRAGLTTRYRKIVEDEFRNGLLKAISCTPTLELGIDVGDVDGVVSSTVPVNRLMQRIGRAARNGQMGFAFLVLGSDPISQYYKNHPDDYFEDSEEAYIDPKNPFIEESQVLAMAYDRAIKLDEMPEYKKTIENHCKSRSLILYDNMYALGVKGKHLISEYNIRGIGRHIDIISNGYVVGKRALPMALEELHENAVYFLAGTKYIVKHFSYPKKMHAIIERAPKNYSYYTKALTDEWPIIEKIYERKIVFGTEIVFCRLHIEKIIHGYANIKIGEGTMQGTRVDLKVPLQYDFVTKGIVFHAPEPIECAADSTDTEYTKISGYHATEHVIIEGSNIITGGASQDLGGISLGRSGLVFVYDGAIGGSGASRALYERFKDVITRAKNIVKECPCTNEAGCPRCTFSYRCGNNNEYLHKISALEILERMCKGEETKMVQAKDGDRSLV